jgi:hypothetical protein
MSLVGWHSSLVLQEKDDQFYIIRKMIDERWNGMGNAGLIEVWQYGMNTVRKYVHCMVFH